MANFISLVCCCQTQDREGVTQKLRKLGRASMVFFCPDINLLLEARERFGPEHCRILVHCANDKEAEYWCKNLAGKAQEVEFLV